MLVFINYYKLINNNKCFCVLKLFWNRKKLKFKMEKQQELNKEEEEEVELMKLKLVRIES